MKNLIQNIKNFWNSDGKECKINNSPQKKHTLLFWCIFIFFSLVYLTIVVTNHYFFRTHTYDYGTFNNMFFDCGHLKANYNPLLYPPYFNTLLMHFYFIMYLLSPLYWIFTPVFGTYSLLIIQWIFFIISAYYTYKFVLNITGNYWLSISTLFLCFINIGKFSAMQADFNPATIGSLIIPIFFYFFDKKKYLWAIIAFIFIISAKENFPLLFIFVSLWLIVVYRKDKQQVKSAIYFCIASLLFFLLITKLIVPSIYNPNEITMLFEYSNMGKNPEEVYIYIFQYPEKAFRLLFENPTGDLSYYGIKSEVYYVILLSGGILFFYKPQHIILIFPLILQKMFHDSPLRWGINWFYFIEISVVLPIILALIINEIKSFRIQVFTTVLILISTIFITNEKLNRRSSLWYSSVKEKFYDVKMYKPDFNIKKIYKYLDIIPKDAKVSASERVAPHLSFRKSIFLFPTVSDAEYIFIVQEKPGNYPILPDQLNNLVELYRKDKNNWETLIDDYPVLIFKRND